MCCFNKVNLSAILLVHKHIITLPCSVVFIAVYSKCVILLLKMGNVKCRTLYNNILTFSVFLYPIIICNFLGPRQALYFRSFGP